MFSFSFITACLILITFAFVLLCGIFEQFNNKDFNFICKVLTYCICLVVVIVVVTWSIEEVAKTLELKQPITLENKQ